MRSSGCSCRSASVHPCASSRAKGLADLGAEQRVVDPALGFVDVELGGDDVVVAGEHDGRAARRAASLRAPRSRSNHLQLVIELGSRRRIAVGQIEAADEHAVDRGLDVAAVGIVRIARAVPRRVSTGSAPRARMATPFQLFWPCQIAP